MSLFLFKDLVLNEGFDKKYTKKYKDIDEFCENINTPEEVSIWFYKNNFCNRWENGRLRNKYMKKYNLSDNGEIGDNPIIWPNDMLKYNYGICYDKALFMAYWCNKHNLKPYIIMANVKPKISFTNIRFVWGHAICAFDTKDRGTYIFDPNLAQELGNALLGPFKNIEEAKNKYLVYYSNILELKAIFDKDKEGTIRIESKESMYCDISVGSPYYKTMKKYYNKPVMQTTVDKEVTVPEFHKYCKNLYDKDTTYLLIDDLSHLCKYLAKYGIRPIINHIRNAFETIHDKIFGESTLLNEASPKKNDGVTPPDEPPDFTSGDANQQQDQNAGGDDQAPPMDGDGAATGGEGEPPMDGGGGDPNAGGDAGGEGEPPMDGDGSGGEGDPNAEGGDGEEPPMDDGSGGDDGMQPPEDLLSPEDELQQSEQQVFAEIKPEQMAIKIGELKNQYKKLNSVIVASLDKVNKISRTTYDDNMVEFISRKLVELKELSRDSLLKSFNTRTYIENQVELQRMVVAFNLITNMISEIKDSREKRQIVIDRENEKNNKRFMNSGRSNLFKVDGARGYNLFPRPFEN